MGKKEKSGWNYIDEAKKKSIEYKHAAEKALSLKNYGEAARDYELAGEVIEEMVREIKENKVNLLEGMVASANMLKIDREEYLKKAQRLRKRDEGKGSSLLKRLGLGAIFLLFTASLFFLQSNFTGFTISKLTQTSANNIGIISLILAVIGLFLHLKKY